MASKYQALIDAAQETVDSLDLVWNVEPLRSLWFTETEESRIFFELLEDLLNKLKAGIKTAKGEKP